MSPVLTLSINYRGSFTGYKSILADANNLNINDPEHLLLFVGRYFLQT